MVGVSASGGTPSIALYAVDVGAQWRPMRWVQVDVAVGQDVLGAMRLVRETCRSRLNQAWYELAMAARTNDGLREGLQAGEEKGRADGLRDGEAKGKADGLREALKVILAARGIEVPAAAMARLESTQDITELQRWAERASVATTWDDVVREAEHHAS